MAYDLQYTGNANLGFGSNPDVPTIATTNLKTLNDTARDIMLIDNERNILRWKQKIADRDRLNELLINNQVSPGEIRPEYQKIFDKAKDEVEKNYIQWGGNLNDTEGFRKYQDKVKQLQDVTAHARAKTIGLSALEQQAAKETLPWKKKKIQDFLDGQKNKGFWDQVDPYDELFSFNIDPVNKLYRTGTAITRSPDGVTTYEDVYGDYGQTLKNAQNEFVNQGETAQDMSEWYKQFDSYDPVQKRKAILAINQQLDKYNKDRGLIQGQDGYVDPIKTVADPQNPNNPRLAEPIQDFSAKWALSQQEKFLTRTPKIDYKLLTAQTARERANVDAIYKQAMASTARMKAGGYLDNIKSLIKSRAKSTDADEQLDELYSRNLIQQPSLITGKGGNRVSLSPVQADNSLPVFTLKGKLPEQLIPLGGKPIYDKYDDVERTKPSKGAKVLYYEGGHYEPIYMMNGKKMDVEKIKDIYLNFKAQAGDSWQGNMDDFIKEAVKNKRFQFLLKGANGTTDEALSRAAQRAISNADTKKGQEGVFAPPTDELVPDTPPDNSDQ